jgi:Eco29kI restriction endonuclease
MRGQKGKPPLERFVPFNPLDKRQLAKSVAEALLVSNLHPFPPPERFLGAGIYAIYYFGNCPIYSRLVERNLAGSVPIPIYVGKAIPNGGRKGDRELDASVGRSLHARLAHHANSIRQATNLDVEDFKCRYLVVDDVWIPLGESLLVRQFQPLWNVVVEGFGNNPTGGPRQGQERSHWDTLHPGRSGTGMATEKGVQRGEILIKRIKAHLD